jgi:hypothetical protein
MMDLTTFRYPTFDEVRAIELSARRARNRELARLAAAAIAQIRRAFFAPSTPKTVRHA